MSALHWIWRELTKPRGRSRSRFYRVGRGSRSGVALLFTITALMFMTVLVTEVTHDATVRIQLAAHHRDEAKAEALAVSGVNFYRLVLVVSKQIGENPMIQTASSFLGINADTLWQLLPFVDSSMLRMVFASGENLTAAQAAAGVTDEVRAASMEDDGLGPKRNFLSFDGDFAAGCTDLNRKIYVGNLMQGSGSFAEMLEKPHALKLLGLMSGEKEDEFFRETNLDRLELVSNLADWTDPDTVRLYQGGDENALYDALEPPYRSKNASFDSTEELRLVDGWHRDDVWKRYGQHLTIYGDGKININTADRRVIKGLIWAYLETPASELLVDEMVKRVMEFRRTPPHYGGGLFNDAQQFIGLIQTQFGYTLKPEFKAAVGTKSTIFRVVSKGTVRNSTVTVEAVFDFSRSPVGQIVYWRIQ